MVYEVEFTPYAARQFKRLAKSAQERLAARIEELADNPRPPDAKALVGEESLYRVREGDYRIIYQIQDASLLILIAALGHRREIYRYLRR